MNDIFSFFAFGARLLPGSLSKLFEEVAFLAGLGEEATPGGLFGPIMALLMLMPMVVFAWVALMGLRAPVGTLERLESRYQRVLGDVGALALVGLTISMSYEVISRYVFGQPTTWAFELSYMLLGSAFVLSIAYCIDQDQHVRVDILYTALSKVGRARIDLFYHIILLPPVAWALIGMIEYFDRSFRIQEASGLSAWDPAIWPFKFALMLGIEILLFRVLIGIVAQISNLRRSESKHV